MTSTADDVDPTESAEAYDVDRHFGDIAPIRSNASPNAPEIQARGAANRMWRKVEEDLERINQATIDDGDDG